MASQGRPLSRVRAILHELDGARYYYLTAESPLGQAVTDDQGRFSVKVPEFTYCELIPADSGRIRKRMNPKPNQPDLGRVMVAEAGTIRGRVTDARTGKPIAGASVGAQFLGTDVESGGYGTARTDEQGRYTIASLDPGLHNGLFSGPTENAMLAAPAHEAG